MIHIICICIYSHIQRYQLCAVYDNNKVDHCIMRGRRNKHICSSQVRGGPPGLDPVFKSESDSSQRLPHRPYHPLPRQHPQKPQPPAGSPPNPRQSVPRSTKPKPQPGRPPKPRQSASVILNKRRGRYEFENSNDIALAPSSKRTKQDEVQSTNNKKQQTKEVKFIWTVNVFNCLNAVIQ